MLSPRAFITIHTFLKLAGDLYLFPWPCSFPMRATFLMYYLSGRTYIDRIEDSEAGSEGTQCTSFLFAIGDQQRISSTGEINKRSRIVNLRTGN